jgi:hypothetical protein
MFEVHIMSELLTVPGEGLPLAEGGEARLRYQPFTIQGNIRMESTASKIIKCSPYRDM